MADTLPADEVPPGAVVEYHGGGLMIVATADTATVRYLGRRRFLHGAVLTLPKSGGPWTIGGPAERVTTPRAHIAVHEQRPAPDRCPCSTHVRLRTH
ncbi:hypothetical protein [Kitasatospora sp. NPDC088548]|uniref:hypothetical protein n=1 Tax=Kitasatospora sp. NPDC088548 TaxID=3364075 RepID=UPI0038218733